MGDSNERKQKEVGSLPLEAPQKYRRLTTLLSNRPIIPYSLAVVVNPVDYGVLSAALVSALHYTNTLLPFIRLLIFSEVKNHLKKNSAEFGSLLRSNSLATKCQTHYVKMKHNESLIWLLGPHVLDVIDDPKSYELDFDRLPANIAGEDADRVLQDNLESLQNAVKLFMDNVFSLESTLKYPDTLRRICSFIVEALIHRATPRDITAQIGGFVVLRIIVPCIISPESIGVNVPPENARRIRRNLTILSKVVQNMANGVLFGEKEPFMVRMNPFIEANMEKIREFLIRFPKAMDKATQDVIEPYLLKRGDDVDISMIQKTSLDAIDELALIADIEKQLESVPVPARMTWKSRLDLENIELLHELLVVYGCELVEKITEYSQRSDTFDTLSLLQNTLKELGAPSSGSVIGKSIAKDDNLLSQVIKTSHNTLSEFLRQREVDTSALDEIRFLYKGEKVAKDGSLVYYIIMTRLFYSVEKIDENSGETIIYHLFKTFEEGEKNPFVIVVDFANFFTQMSMTAIFKKIEYIFDLFPDAHKVNLKEVVFLHAQALTGYKHWRFHSYIQWLLFLREKSQLVSDVTTKVTSMNSWQELTRIIEEEDIELPQSSVNYITKMYKVTKVNSKGKRQQRFVKFTSTSLLNIDSKAVIRNEIKYSEIESFHVESDGNLLLTLTPPIESRGKRKKSLFSDRRDLYMRRYKFTSDVERSAAIIDLTEHIQGTLSKREYPQWFSATKVNSFGMAQHREFKITEDSILNMKKKAIRKEWSILNIDKVFVEEDANVSFKLVTEDKSKKFIFKTGTEAELFVNAIRELIKIVGEDRLRAVY